MEFKLIEVSGLAQAVTSLWMSKRHYNVAKQLDMMRKINYLSNFQGFIARKPHRELAESAFPNTDGTTTPYEEVYAEVVKELNKVAKWGAGVGGEAWKDDGHETLLRFIDITFAVTGLHRGAMDDLDSHAKRFDNRIVRSSTRFDGAYKQSERSAWYNERILSTEEVLTRSHIDIPERVTIDGTEYVKVANGYAVAGEENNGDVLRGNYPLSIPMDAILKIDFFDLRHVYMRRNRYTHASPELKIGIESLADQIENVIPGDLGKLIRYDYVQYHDEDGDYYGMAHVMDIKKTFSNRTGLSTDPNIPEN